MNRIIYIDGISRDDGIVNGVARGLCKDWVFSGGEHGIQFYTGDKRSAEFADLNAPFYIFLRNADGRAIMEVLNVNNAMRHMGYKDIRLIMPYVPYGRADRVTTPGTSFGLEMFAQVINTAQFNEVFVVDPHSPVTEKLIHNVRVIHPEEAMAFFPRNQLRGLAKDLVIVAPDKGAVGRAMHCALALGVPDDRLAYASKERDPKTGDVYFTGIVGYDIKPDDELLLIDDICDGGATFLSLAKILKNDYKLTTKPSLYVTHGIFSKGLDELYRYFNTIVCTDSFYRKDLDRGTGAKSDLRSGSVIPTELLMKPYWDAITAS